MSDAGACLVCFRPTTSFNYGAACCNACKMFFRRAVASPRERICLNNGLCNQRNANPNCKKCRFQKCLEAGMQPNLVLDTRVQQGSDQLPMLISKLSALYNHRQQLFFHCHVTGDPNLSQALRGPLNFTERPHTLSFKLSDWQVNEQLTNIDFLRNLDFVKLLNPEDRSIYIQNSFTGLAVFMNAMRNYSERRASLAYPFVENSPDLPVLAQGFSDGFKRRMMTKLIGKLAELRISNVEYMLVSVLIFCQSDIPELSDNAKTLINTYQRLYSSALLQHCLITYQRNAPSRFMELISVCHVIKATIEDVTCFFSILKMMINLEEFMEWSTFYKDFVKFVLKI